MLFFWSLKIRNWYFIYGQCCKEFDDDNLRVLPYEKETNNRIEHKTHRELTSFGFRKAHKSEEFGFLILQLQREF